MEGIVFGGYLLPKEQFIEIATKWYEDKRENLKYDLKKEIIDPIEDMIKKVENDQGKDVYQRTKDYNANKIYLAWEKITQKYFGNDKITLLAAAKFENNSYNWAISQAESDAINESGINVNQNFFEKDTTKLLKNILLINQAQTIENIFNNHLDNLIKTLNIYRLNKREAELLHIIQGFRKSKAGQHLAHYTNQTYDDIIFGKQQNKEGKKVEAFMSHMANYHTELFHMLQTNLNNGNNSGLIQYKEDSFASIFAKEPAITQNWLLDSLNSTSWVAGGDIVIIDEDGKIIYNIQLKTTRAKKGKNFSVAMQGLLNLTNRLVEAIDNIKKPKELAEVMYNSLKIQSSNYIDESIKFATDAVINNINQNLLEGYNK